MSAQAVKTDTKRRRVVTPARIMAPRLLLIGATLALLIFGLVMAYSASSVVALNESGDAAYYFKKQLQFIAVGLVFLAGTAAIPYTFWRSGGSWIAWGIIVALLLLVLIRGIAGFGAQRWIPIAGFTLQPSEFAKIVMVLVAATLVVRVREEGSSRAWILRVLFAVGIPAVLIIVEPDVGTTVVALVGVVAVFWFGEFRKSPIFIGLGVIGLAVVILVSIPGYWHERFIAFLNPWDDPSEGGYQIINSYYALADGGLFGVGGGLSRQKYYYLFAAQNDFIFAIIGEEYGLLGTTLVVVFFVLFIYAGLKVARNALDLQGRLIAGAATALIGFQAFLNMLCVVGLAPITGKPLPFISTGGTSMLATLILVGLILSVSFHSNEPDSAARRRDELLIIDGGGGLRQSTPREAPITSKTRENRAKRIRIRERDLNEFGFNRCLPSAPRSLAQAERRRP